MTLDELLALLPDNNTGAIDAADLRTIVTELWNDGAKIEARVSALEVDSGGGSDSSISVSGIWQVNPQVDATPGGKQVTSDTALWTNTTLLRFDDHDQDNMDQSTVLLSATEIFMQQEQNAENWVRYAATGGGSHPAGYVEVPVTFLNGGGSITTAQWQDAVVVMKVPA